MEAGAIVVTAESLALLDSEGIRDITPDDLARQLAVAARRPLPDVLVRPTIAAVRTGRDEVLEAGSRT